VRLFVAADLAATMKRLTGNDKQTKKEGVNIPMRTVYL
jgi:hypothetical protein